jgi:dTDP-4-dehydrorhamnose 3,5-epimerase-like enzyme
MNIQPIQLPRITDPRGNLSFLEDNNQIPFKIRRVHWIYDVPGGAERGGIAYERTEEFIIAMSGSFDVVIDDGKERQIIQLNRSYMGVYVPKGMWRAIENFSTNSIAVIATSTHYDPAEGIRDYTEFKKIAAALISDNTKPTGRPYPLVNGMFNVYDCNIIEIDKHHSDSKGNISVVENGDTVPFDVKRMYYLYDVPGGVSRGGHAHKELSQFIIAASGSFTVTLDDGNVRRAFTLNRPYQGLLVKPGVWRNLDDFSSGSVCLVLASEKYDESDYIREYDEFLEYRRTR